MPEIEYTIKTATLPANSYVLLARLSVLMREHKTNHLGDCKNDLRIKAVLWLLVSQVFGEFAMIDMHALYCEIAEQL